jgi:asparagine synthetase B (glutamine-hydrolysing)
VETADRIAAVVRARLLAATATGHGSRVGLALSGGVDSTSILAAMVGNGWRPSVVSYTPSTHESTDWRMARAVAQRGGMRFVDVRVPMDGDELEPIMRAVIAAGFKTKLEVECLVPMWFVALEAREADLETLYTGDQADGFFINNNWMARNFDRARGIPGPLRLPVAVDDDPWRIDALRDIYWHEDRSCSGPLATLASALGVDLRVPYRDEAIREAFKGSLWRDVNEPRLKEPLRLAFPEFIDSVVPTRPAPVNLHRGDSYFADRFGKMMMARLPGPWKTTTGLYAAIARGEA